MAVHADNGSVGSTGSDAARLADGTHARDWLEHPITFHGTFVPTSR
jgi:hypothetical protein